MTSPDALRGNIEAGLRLLLKSEKPLYRQAAEVGITDLRRLFEQYQSAQLEADIQLGEKLAAQMTLKAVCDALNLPMVSLGNGWTEATPKILARIEEIVDEAERGFRERDSWEKVAREYEAKLVERNLL